MILEILIGRAPDTSQLKLSCEGKDILYGEKGSVPRSVSRQHCSISLLDNKKYLLKNLNEQNVTKVSGVEIISKTISENDEIFLGTDSYRLPWEAVLQVIPPLADIRPLKAIWDEYTQDSTKLKIYERRFGVLRSGISIVTMLAIALGIFLGRNTTNIIYLGLYAFAILLSVFFFVKAYRQSSNLVRRQEELVKRFQSNCVCPHCHHFLGGYGFYENLAQNDKCPHCKTRFIK